MSERFRFTCRECGKEHDVPSGYIGRPATCRCGLKLTISPPSHLVIEPDEWSERAPPIRNPEIDLETQVVTPLRPEFTTEARALPIQINPGSIIDHEVSYAPIDGIRRSNQALAGVGAALLLIGQFLPMVNAPLGVWMSFLDFPWKAASVVLRHSASRVEDSEPNETARNRRNATRNSGKRNRVPMTVATTATVSIAYPIIVIVVVLITFGQILAGRNTGPFVLMGSVALSATLLYGAMILLLNTQKEFQLVMELISPGFGWGVVIVGALSLIASGFIRTRSA